jgi:hypothetical protein
MSQVNYSSFNSVAALKTSVTYMQAVERRCLSGDVDACPVEVHMQRSSAAAPIVTV